MIPAIFAEYLGHVHTINLTVQRDPLTTAECKVTFKDNVVKLYEGQQEYSITLPTSLLHETDLNDCLPVRPATFKTSRLKSLPLASIDDSLLVDFVVPWSAEDFQPSISIRCASVHNCGATLLPSSHLFDYRDLPSATWAEMMDLWHCHKPEEPLAVGATIDTKGYSAASRLSARTGTLFIDTLSFLMSEPDCSNIKILENERVVCNCCNSQIGEWDPASSGVRLFKPFVSLHDDGTKQPISPETPQWFSCYLLALIDGTGVRKFQSRYSNFTIWIFSPKVIYSISSSGGKPSPAMRILFKTEKTDGDQKLTAQSLHVEELTLPRVLEGELLNELIKANDALPEPIRLFQDWRVALLDRLSDSASTNPRTTNR